MKLSELIKQLQEIQKEHTGNIECYTTSFSGEDQKTLEIVSCELRIDNHGKFVDIH